MECKLRHHYDVTNAAGDVTATAIIGEVVMIHIHEEVRTRLARSPDPSTFQHPPLKPSSLDQHDSPAHFTPPLPSPSLSDHHHTYGPSQLSTGSLHLSPIDVLTPPSRTISTDDPQHDSPAPLTYQPSIRPPSNHRGPAGGQHGMGGQAPHQHGEIPAHVAVGRCAHCPPRHGVSLHSRDEGLAWRILLATSYGAIQLKRRGSKAWRILLTTS